MGSRCCVKTRWVIPAVISNMQIKRWYERRVLSMIKMWDHCKFSMPLQLEGWGAVINFSILHTKLWKATLRKQTKTSLYLHKFSPRSQIFANLIQIYIFFYTKQCIVYDSFNANLHTDRNFSESLYNKDWKVETRESFNNCEHYKLDESHKKTNLQNYTTKE